MLNQLFSSEARVRVLKLLLLNAGRDFYLREMASLAEVPVRAVQREVERLKKIGLIEEDIRGNRHYYSVNEASPIFPELKSIFMKTVGLGDTLQNYLREAKGEIDLAFIYGSYARGDEGKESDIDLVVIGNIGAKQISSMLARAKSDLGREINAFNLTPKEFRERASHGDHFVSSLLQEPKIFLAGSENELLALAPPGTTEKA